MLRRFLLILFLLPFYVCAQERDSSQLVRSFAISYENDLLTLEYDTTTDYYYTGGTFIEFELPWLKKTPVSKVLFALPNGRDESFGISYNNLAFTPTSILSDSILIGDRPFSGTIYLGLNRVSCNIDKQMRLTSRLDLGAIGPVALAYETQKFIHAHTRNPEPHGWQYQIANDVYANYSLRLEKGLLLKNRFVELIGMGTVNAGTIYSNAVAGLKIRAGRMPHYFSADRFANQFQFWVYANGECKVIARDATLQGGLLNDGSVYFISSGDVKRAVFLFTGGAVVAYHNVRFEFFNTLLTPEFSGGKHHAWGHLGLQVLF